MAGRQLQQRKLTYTRASPQRRTSPRPRRSADEQVVPAKPVDELTVQSRVGERSSPPAGDPIAGGEWALAAGVFVAGLLAAAVIAATVSLLAGGLALAAGIALSLLAGPVLRRRRRDRAGRPIRARSPPSS